MRVDITDTVSKPRSPSAAEGLHGDVPAALTTSANTSSLRLPPILGSFEICGFGFAGLLLWVMIAPGVHAALGAQALWLWLPVTLVAIISNRQISTMAAAWPGMSGGTPNYVSRLFKHNMLGRYAALSYFQGRVAVLTISATLFANVLLKNLHTLGVDLPQWPLQLMLIALVFIIAFAGTRALSILQSTFALPALGLLLLFCVQGMLWLSLAAPSPELAQHNSRNFNFIEWAQWFFVAIYAAYAMETASAFAAESRRPECILRSLKAAAYVMPLVFIVGSWVLMRLAVISDGAADGQIYQQNIWQTLWSAALPFWGEYAHLLVIILILSACLYSAATACASAPRILYQLAQDGSAAPLFGLASRQGVAGPSLVLTLLVACVFVLWGDLTRMLVIASSGYFATFILMHWGLWRNRGVAYVYGAGWALLFFMGETVIFVVGGIAWGWLDVLIGLLFPVLIMSVDSLIRRYPIVLANPAWWEQFYRSKLYQKAGSGWAAQVMMIIFIVCAATTIGWNASAWFGSGADPVARLNLIAIFAMAVVFLGVAIACWITLPQLVSINAAREQATSEAHHLFVMALDAILFLDERGVIQNANPAAQKLFGMDTVALTGRPLEEFLSGIKGLPSAWALLGGKTLKQGGQQVVEISMSPFSVDGVEKYTVMLHNITERKRYETRLADSAKELERKNAALETSTQQLIALNSELASKTAENESFLYAVSHDLRSPLVNLQGFNQELKDIAVNLSALLEQADCPPQIRESGLKLVNTTMQEALRFIQAGVTRLSNLIDALLHVSRVGRVEYHWQMVDLNPVVQRIVDAMNSIINQRSARVTVHALPPAWGDSSALEQIFANLIGNALNYLDAARPGVIEVGHIVEKSTPATNTYYVKDNGLGMSDLAKSMLFQIFQRFHPKVAKGEGVGLTLTKRIIERHKGSITVESSEGVGTTWFITLPSEKPESDAVIS